MNDNTLENKKQHDMLDSKKSVSIFYTRKGCPLNYVDQLVFCYRAHQDSYETIPSHRRVALATGLKQETTAKATIDRLHKQFGLLRSDCSVVTPCPHMDWFRPLESLREQFGDQHLSKWMQNWRSLVRQPGGDNPLSVPCVTLYSLIRHSTIHNCKPREGWSGEFLSMVLGMNAKTVSTALEKLEALGFLSVEDGMKFKLFKLNDDQLKFFADKRAWSGTASAEPDEFVDDYSPKSHIVAAEFKARTELRGRLDRSQISDGAKRKIYDGIVCQKEWFTGSWMEVAEKAIDKFMALEDAR